MSHDKSNGTVNVRLIHYILLFVIRKENNCECGLEDAGSAQAAKQPNCTVKGWVEFSLLLLPPLDA